MFSASLGYGAGGEARQTLGQAIVGGLLFSQLITLYLTPVVYTYMAAISERKTPKKRHMKVPDTRVASRGNGWSYRGHIPCL